MMSREPSWEKNGLSPIVNIMQTALDKSQSMRKTSHEPVFIA